MRIFVAGLSYKTAPVEIRERLAVHGSRLYCCGCRLKLGNGLSEVVLVSTCNRVEIYGVTDGRIPAAVDVFQHLAPGIDSDLAPYLFIKEGAHAIQHLFSVTSGLDSLVLGETEINGQIKNAYHAAQSAKLTGRVLNRLFQAAFQTAKEIRTRTSIGRGATSVGSVAVELAEEIFNGKFTDKTVMILGTGKMGEACVRHLAKKGATSVLVSNRSYDKAVVLAGEIGGKAIRFDDYLHAMQEADIVVSSTACPHTILNKQDVEGVMLARANRPLFLIDIAVPRDIAADVEEVPNVHLYDVDDLEVIMRENVRSRAEEMQRCQSIIAEHCDAVMQKLSNGPSATPRRRPAVVEEAWSSALLTEEPMYQFA